MLCSRLGRGCRCAIFSTATLKAQSSAFLIAKYPRVSDAPGKQLACFAGGAPQTSGKGTDMKQPTTEQRLARLIELKAQRDEIDREIAVLLGDAPAPRRTRPSVRAMTSSTGEPVSQSKTIESADTIPSVDSNDAGS